MLDKRIMTFTEKNNKLQKYNTMKFLGLPLPPLLLRCHDPSLEVSTPRGYTLIPGMMMSNIRVFAIHIDMQMSLYQCQHSNVSNVVYHDVTVSRSQTSNNNMGDIHIATYNRDINRVRDMISSNRELLWCKDAKGNIPLHLALENGHKDVAIYLIGEFPQGSYALNHYEESPLYLGVAKGYKDLVEFMLKNLSRGKEATESLKKGKSILFCAIAAKNQEMVQVILKHQPKLMKTTNNEGWSPLTCAANDGLTDIIGLFLKTSPDLVNKDVSYPIHKACKRGHIQALKMFHTHCPKSLTKANGNGQTILHLAAQEPNNKLKNVVLYLLSLPEGKKLLKIQDETNGIPLALARNSGNDEVVEILTQNMSS